MSKLNRVLFKILLTSLIFVCFLSSVSAKDKLKTDQEYIGKIITLEEYEGDIKITNSAKRELKLRNNSKLYNGYSVTTEDSYAWISLDKNGIIKLDYDTSVILKKKGKELEIVLEKGSIFFDISQSFAKDESLKIKSSTMTTGIRGTLGIATSQTLVDLSTYFSLILLEGKVELEYIETQAKYQELAKQMKAGYRFELISQLKEDKTPDINEVMTKKELESHLTKLEIDDINGFVAIEIKNNKDIQKRLKASGFSEEELNKIIDQAIDKLHDDQQALNKSRLELENLIKNQESILYPLANPKKEVIATPIPTIIESKNNSKVNNVVNYFTVTYKYQSQLFGTQKVVEGQVISKPTLIPSPSGVWKNGNDVYDFNQAVNNDLTLIWSDTIGITND